MNHLTADESMCDHLRGILEPVEIRDANGKLLGTFAPNVTAEERAAYEKVRARIDLTEMRRRMETERGEAKPFADMIRRLEAGEFQG
jgi:hypothetical protein